MAAHYVGSTEGCSRKYCTAMGFFKTIEVTYEMWQNGKFDDAGGDLCMWIVILSFKSCFMGGGKQYPDTGYQKSERMIPGTNSKNILTNIYIVLS